MPNSKIENLFNLALSATPTERNEAEDLGVGYNENDNTWEVVVRYNGNLQEIIDMGVVVTPLIGGYAVLTVPEPLINTITGLPQIEYMEKPKSLYFAVQQGKAVSCFNRNLTGRGTIVAILDSGVDYRHPDFINEDGSSRILYIWDQSIAGNPPEGYNIGTEYNNAQINEALLQTNTEDRLRIVPSSDRSGHGTHVLGIAAGNGRASNGRFAGCAPECDIIVVKLGTTRMNAFPMTTELMQGINYIIQKSLELGKPVAINISYGNSYGSHTGRSLLETYINDISNVWKNTIQIGTGNEGATGRHISGILKDSAQTIELIVNEYTPSFSIQIWKNYYDEMDISIIAPDGSSSGIIPVAPGTDRFRVGEAELLIYYGEPTPYSINQEIFIQLIPSDLFFRNGVWKIVLTPRKIINGSYDMWLPSGDALNTGTRFLRPTVNTTLTIPSTASSAISVGAYDSTTDEVAYFTGRGYTRDMVIKPDIVAPGVNITSAAPGGGYEIRSGTSMATPFVTGAASLLMQWGIVEGNDPFLYGEKVKAYFLRGARQLPGYEVWPNPQAGYGALCVAESIPREQY